LKKTLIDIQLIAKRRIFLLELIESWLEGNISILEAIFQRYNYKFNKIIKSCELCWSFGTNEQKKRNYTFQKKILKKIIILEK
jgi:hypothetical protein